MNPRLDKTLIELSFLLIIAIVEEEVCKNDSHSSVLIFLPGIMEIMEFEQNFKIMFFYYLETLAQTMGKNVDELKSLDRYNLKICQLHSGISE